MLFNCIRYPEKMRLSSQTCIWDLFNNAIKHESVHDTL